MINKTHVSTVSMSSNQTASQCLPPSRYFQMAILGQKSSTVNKKAGNPTKNRWFHMAMDQYLLIPFLGEWTSIYQLFWCSPGVQGFDTLPYPKTPVMAPKQMPQTCRSSRKAVPAFGVPISVKSALQLEELKTLPWWFSHPSQKKHKNIQKERSQLGMII